MGKAATDDRTRARARSADGPAPAPSITPADRLGATVALSLIFHGVLAFGVGFAREDPAPLVPTLDVILTQTRSEQPPEQADFLAQASQRGGGDSEVAERPREPQLSQVPKPDPGVAPQQQAARAPDPEPQARQPVLTAQSPSERSESAEQRLEQPVTPLPSSRELIEQSLEMARLSAEIERAAERYAKRPRRKFISANTREYEYAAYMRAWVARVERVGNLNYPDEARRRNLQGQLVMTVAVRRDGTVENVTVVQPSGYPVLDQSATDIVRLAEPFPPLPVTDENVDILHITRTWQFLPGAVLRNR